MSKTLLDRSYSGESFFDISRDVEEAVEQVPRVDGYEQGTLKITVEWSKDE